MSKPTPVAGRQLVPAKRRAVAAVPIIGLLLSILVVGSASEARAASAFVEEAPDASWGVVDGPVYATLQVGSTVYVGGHFSTAISTAGWTVARKNLAAFDMNTGELLTSFSADAGSVVRALATDGRSLYVGGSFGRLGADSRDRIGKVDLITGAVDANFAPVVDDTVRAIELDGNDVIIGGVFDTVNGVARSRLAKLDKRTGALVTGFRAAADDAVLALKISPATRTLYVGGSFSVLSGAFRNGLGAVNLGAGSVVGPSFANSTRPTYALDMNEDGSRLFGGGGSSTNNTAAWDPNTGVRRWRVITDGDNQALDYFEGMVYFGFHDGYQGDSQIKLLAADAMTGAVDPNFEPRFDQFWGVWSVSVSALGVVAGGDFTSVNGVPASSFARFPVAGPLSSPSPTAVALLGPNSSWRYWDRGTAPANWASFGFDDSAWPSGPPRLGYGDTFDTTVIGHGPPGAGKYLTAYFRAGFTLDTIPEGVSFGLSADDGAVVYLNGTEVERENMPAGRITSSTLALTNRYGSAETAVNTFSVDPGLLRVGDNVVAVEVHQYAAISADLGVELRANALYDSVPLGGDQPPTATSADSVVVAAGSSWRWRFASAAPPSSWASRSFVDSSWAVGDAVLGYGDSSVVTSIDRWGDGTADRPRAAYFRRSFTVPDVSKATRLVITSVANDGAVFYVNGVEVSRVNMPSGTITNLTYASSGRNTRVANADPVVIDVPTSLLVTGKNVVAVESHLNYRASRDLTFDLAATLTSTT